MKTPVQEEYIAYRLHFLKAAALRIQTQLKAGTLTREDAIPQLDYLKAEFERVVTEVA